MIKGKLTDKQEKSAKILAHVLHGINAAKTVDEWETYINENGHDAKKFFGTNSAGYEEYQNFINSHDRQRYEDNLRKARKPRKR